MSRGSFAPHPYLALAGSVLRSRKFQAMPGHYHMLREAGEIMGVRVRDHIVIGKGRYVSLVDDG